MAAEAETLRLEGAEGQPRTRQMRAERQERAGLSRRAAMLPRQGRVPLAASSPAVCLARIPTTLLEQPPGRVPRAGEIPPEPMQRVGLITTAAASAPFLGRVHRTRVGHPSAGCSRPRFWHWGHECGARDETSSARCGGAVDKTSGGKITSAERMAGLAGG